MTNRPPQTQISRLITQTVKTIQAKVNPEALGFKPGAKVAELKIEEPNSREPQSHKLVGEYYRIGRSSRSCDIVVRNPVVSQVHCSIERDRQHPRRFLLKDEGSTNGIYWGKKQVERLQLHHGDRFSLGPPDLAAAVNVQFYHPQPIWVQLLSYILYFSGVTLALIVAIGVWQWSEIKVVPLPINNTGPVIVFARDGQTNLNPIRNNAHQDLAQLSDFSEYLPDAVIASEDSRYYWHFGIDPYGIVRAIAVNLQQQGVRQGASTITQQLARSLFPEVGRERTAVRKLREIIVASKLEAYYSKDELLKTYLNRVFLGFNNYGFEDAARFYFDKSAADLNLNEAATLVAILPAPNSFNPVRDQDTALQLRNRVISRMQDLGMISETEANTARRSRIEISPRAREALASTIAPYFYSHVYAELRDILGRELAAEGNFIVETSLNPQIQQQAETALQQTVASDGARFNFSQGALVTLDSQSGEILSMVGGVDFAQSQFNIATQAQRQPGSTFKVFAYAAAIERGVSPFRTYSCSPVRWQGQQYRGCERSSGDIDMFRGLAQSENAIALRVAQDAGLNRVVQMARRLGVTSPLDPVPGLVIGQSETNVLEMTGAYGAIANGGVWQRPHAIRIIRDGANCEDFNNYRTCRIIYDFNQDQNNTRRAISPGLAATMTRLLRGVVQGGTGASASIGFGEAGKTGTTDRAVDLWFIGYIPSRQLVTGIWLGNEDNSPTTGSSSQAAALWGRYMSRVVNN